MFSRSRALSLLLIILLVLPVYGQSLQTTFHVSPGGSDRNIGSVSLPFKTVGRARDAVRALRTAQPSLADTVFVFLHGGRYRLNAPLRLGPDDGGTTSSPTMYAAAPGEKPVISGGVALTGWTATKLDGKNVWTASLPEAVRRVRPEIRELWVNNERRSPARFPNTGTLAVDSIPEITPSMDWMEGQRSFVVKKNDIPASLDLAGGSVVLGTKWVESYLPVVSFDRDSSKFRFSRRSVFRIDRGDVYYLLYARGALDVPGEWWQDVRRGKLYYMPRPGEDIRTVDAVVPLLEQLVLINGEPERGRWVEHLIFRGITFSHAEWFFPKGYKTDSRNADAGGFNQAATGVPAAVACSGMRHSTFEECTIEHVGTYGLSWGAACQDNTLIRSELSDLGAGGVFLGLKTIEEDRALLTQRNRMIDNHIHDGGKIFHSAIGIWIGQSPFNRIIHNHIHDFLYTGISIGWTWGYGRAQANGNIVELNHVHHIGVLSNGDGPFLSDLGGIYTLGYHRGTEIRRNVFHDIAARVYGGWGIYFDEGTTNIRAQENLVYRTLHGGFHQHYGRENIFRNNIIAFGHEYQVEADPLRTAHEFCLREQHHHLEWRTGVLRFDEGQQSDHGPESVLAGTGAVRVRFPRLRRLAGDRVRWHSKIADPMFVDPAGSDFRLKDGSPAFGLGFRQFDLSAAYSSTPTGDDDPPRRLRQDVCSIITTGRVSRWGTTR